MRLILLAERLVDLVGRTLKYLAAALLLAVSLLISADVLGRAVFSHPIDGVAEIVANGIVVIAFLQVTYAVTSGAMLRSELLLTRLGPVGLRIAETVSALLGALLFYLIARASWSPMIRAIETKEFAGYSGFQMPVWPVRVVIETGSILAIAAYLLIALRTALIGVRPRPVDAAPAL
ncbi:TRAP transporter small permease [Tropicimonas sediminicola]|uniref:TRAP transporter small permease protein n=1 Tax=Tropicimonas sediminicola TaxID=1031541 RepID=A0A239LCR2_9RHOB|nr:TRAP transporter small permease [Tropicimonas sediminicola]SNT27742.1 TRAP-type C4-dicarboxylate transport system, small permease component [Tropicimonas sediminicola]